jgi:hypothetical protein
MQEFLNRHEGHLWGFVSNGLKFRILRDNKSLTRQAYVEFDLAGMMANGQLLTVALSATRRANIKLLANAA